MSIIIRIFILFRVNYEIYKEVDSSSTLNYMYMLFLFANNEKLVFSISMLIYCLQT